MASPAPAPPPFSLLADFRNALLRQLDNSFVGGSVALAAASALLSLAWRALRWLATALHDAAFTRYELPVGSPQCIAAARFLQAHAGGRTARRLVLDARAARLAADVTARGNHAAYQAAAAAAEAEALAGDAPRYVMLPALAGGGGALLRWRGHLVWARASAGNADTQYAAAQHGYDGWSPWGGGSAPFAFSGGYGTSASAAAAAASASGAAPAGSLALLVLRRPFSRDRGEAAVAALLAEGERLAAGGDGVDSPRYTQLFYAQAPRNNPALHWTDAGRRPSRLISSVVLPGDTAASVLADARAFLAAEAWYAQRGIPYRRGYLFHGGPGCGKTSLITALAGELRLPVYILRLAAPGMDDDTLHALLAQTAPRAAVLLEDVDAAFKPLQLAAPESGAAMMTTSHANGDAFQAATAARVTYSGLLNALDGVGAAESRLLFLTTNDVAALPPALVRPGRVDVRVPFGPADAAQARELFLRFYAPGGGGVSGAEDAALAAQAAAFAGAVRAGRHSMAALQGHLLRHRGAAAEAVRTAPQLAAEEADAPGAAAATLLAATPAPPQQERSAERSAGTPMQLRRRASRGGGAAR